MSIPDYRYAPPAQPVEPAYTREEDASLDKKLKVPKARKTKPSEATELRRRASVAQAHSKQGITLTLRVPLPLYKALVELAEEYHLTVPAVGRQCLSDGVRKYRDFSDPARSPVAPPPMRQTFTLPDNLPRAGYWQTSAAELATEELTSAMEKIANLPIDALLPQGINKTAPLSPTEE